MDPTRTNEPGGTRPKTLRPLLDSSALMMAMVGEARAAAEASSPAAPSGRVGRLKLVAVALAAITAGLGLVVSQRARAPVASASVAVAVPAEVAPAALAPSNDEPEISIEIDDAIIELDESDVPTKAPKAAALALQVPSAGPVVQAQSVLGAIDTQMVARLGARGETTDRAGALALPSTAAAPVAPVAPVRATPQRGGGRDKSEARAERKTDLSWNKAAAAPEVEPAVNPEALKAARREQSVVDLARRVRLSCGSIARATPGGLSVRLKVSVDATAAVASAAAPGAPEALAQCMDRIARAHSFPTEAAGRSFEVAFTWRSQ